MPPSCGPTSTLPAPVKGADPPGVAGSAGRRPIEGWSHHEDPHPGRRTWSFPGHPDHPWSGSRHPPTDPAAGPGPGAPTRGCGPAPQSAGLRSPVTRRTPLVRTGPPCGTRGSPRSSPSPTTRSPTGSAKGRRGGRPPAFDKVAYRRRNQVERGFNRRKHWRGLATRYDKLAANFQATLDLVETLDWLRAVPDNQDPQDRT